jgi:tetratricopeptide (TPR) repeat protein
MVRSNFFQVSEQRIDPVRYLLKCGSFKIAHSLLSLALRTYKESKITEAGILADTLFSLATLGVETNQDSATILSYSLEHLKVRIDLNRGEWKDQELLSMAHCRLAQAYMFGGEYEKAISHCKHSKSVLSIDPESCAWYQWSQIFQAWCLIATSDLEEAESVILAQLQYQTEHVPSKESGSLMYNPQFTALFIQLTNFF